MPINVALLKYGFKNFILTILEYCEVGNLVIREKYYFNIYSPEYNILKTPGNPSQGPGRIFSGPWKEKISIASKKRSQSPTWVANQSIAQSKSIKLEVTDLKTNTISTFHAIRAAARALNIDKRYIEQYINLKQVKPVLDRYTFKLIEPNSNRLGDLVLQSTTSTPHNSVANKLNRTAIKLEVTNLDTNETTKYLSIGDAARALLVRQPSLSIYLKSNRNKPFKGKYIIKKL